MMKYFVKNDNNGIFLPVNINNQMIWRFQRMISW